MSITDYGRNDSITLIKSTIPQDFKANKAAVSNNKFMTNLNNTNPEPGMIDYGALLSFMPEEIKTNPKYTQPEIQPIKNQSTVATKTIDLNQKALGSVAPAKDKSSIYDLDPSSLSKINATSSLSTKSADVAIDPNISTKATEKAIAPSNLDVDPKKVAAELKEKQMLEAMKKEDLSFLRKG